jgi:hypothetical protein
MGSAMGFETGKASQWGKAASEKLVKVPPSEKLL